MRSPIDPDKRFELLQKVGSGDGIESWRVRDRIDGAERLLKRRARGLSLRQRFSRAVPIEVRIAARIRHPDLPEPIAWGRTRRWAWWQVRPWLDGIPFDRFVASGDRDRERTFEGIGQLLAVLGSLHGAGWVHRDVSPRNLLWVPSERRLKLLDLGHAAPVGARGSLDPRRGGTLGYAAPEQLSGASASVAADQFAVAAVAVEQLSGRLPWPAVENGRRFAAWLAEHPPTIDPSSLDLAEDRRTRVAALLERGLSPDPSSRWPSLALMAREWSALA